MFVEIEVRSPVTQRCSATSTIKKSASVMSQQPQPRKVLHLPKVRMLARGGRLASGIRITNVKSIRPPNPEMVKKQEADQFKAEMQQEIAARSRSCAHADYDCWLPVLAGRSYCGSHILQDATAPYVQCAHTAQGERCAAPAHKDQKDEPLCFEHARAALISRHKAGAPPPPVISTETLLHQLQHYVKPERPRTNSCASSVSVVSEPSQEPDQISPVAIDPFKQMDATAINAAFSSSILECASGSDSDGESVTLGPDSSCRNMNCADDTEDATVEDAPLWRAGVYTAEEAVSETRRTLSALQTAYIQQMDRLKRMLMTARLHYLRTLKQEKEQHCSINSQARGGPLSARERRQLRKLKAYAGYHRKHGAEAVLARKLHKKRAKSDTNPNRYVPSVARCTFVEETVRCANLSVPASKHCAKHILHDRNQVLFYPCSDIRGLDSCKEPVCRLPASSGACRYHTDPPQYMLFTLKKDDSGSETDSQTSIQQLTDCSSPIRAEPVDP